MLRLVTFFVTGVLIIVGTFLSVLSVASFEPRQNRLEATSLQIESLKREPQTCEVKERIADLSWQLNRFSDAETIWYEKWKDLATRGKAAKYAEFTKIASNLAAVYTDHGNFENALQMYDMAIDYDRKVYGEKSKEVARDLNNRALCRYLKGTTLAADNDRKKFFEDAMKDCRESSTMLTQLNLKQSEFNRRNNQSIEILIERDLKKQAH